jgi:hypothetical protein
LKNPNAHAFDSFNEGLERDQPKKHAHTACVSDENCDPPLVGLALLVADRFVFGPGH